MTITRSCLCGELGFEAAVAPRRVTHCHCNMCRKATGAAVATFATFESSKVSWNGELSRYDSSDVGWRGFCPACGSSVCFGFKPRPERIYIAIGIFDDPDAFPARFHDHREAKIKWLQVDEDTPDVP